MIRSSKLILSSGYIKTIYFDLFQDLVEPQRDLVQYALAQPYSRDLVCNMLGLNKQVLHEIFYVHPRFLVHPHSINFILYLSWLSDNCTLLPCYFSPSSHRKLRCHLSGVIL